ncbi:MAG: putative DNA modification/repair radical SAM protein [Bacillota bacterium]|nr:putative DNA modification/repair radical SAM protein [Bacillota bacterium]
MDKLISKLKILAEGAKYDVSCSSSGVERRNKGKLGNSRSFGICHTWSIDGRCISLLKVLMSNNCIYDCSYCINKVSSDIERASFSPEEMAKITYEFYRRNYIEGLFLSSAVEKNPDYTSEKMCKTLEILRNKYGFSGYIHVKGIPNASKDLMTKLGFLADRISINIELPSQESLKILAPQKNTRTILLPMKNLNNQIMENKDDKSKYKASKKFLPAGQTTQMIVGASQDSDYQLLKTSQILYDKFQLKRVYYSAYIPVVENSLLPAVNTKPPLKREHRLYQADWLLRFYKFRADELLTEVDRNFDLEFDPKINWALNNIHLFPKEVNKVSYDELLRIPGIGPKSAQRIVKERRFLKVNYENLKKMGVVLKRAKYFLTCDGKYHGGIDIKPDIIKYKLGEMENDRQLSFF